VQAMPFRMGPMEIGLILLIILIVFGVGKLPQVGGAIGKAIHEFRKAQRDDYDEDKAEHNPKSKPNDDQDEMRKP
jgi:sec-independent protein translocase protein TatA